MWKLISLALLALLAPQTPTRTYENSLVIAPLYVEYATATDKQFAEKTAELKTRIGSGPHVLLGFASFLYIRFPAHDLNDPLTPRHMDHTLRSIDRIVDRARANDIVVHIALTSGFFHNHNDLRVSAIRQDVRNAQWFADGSISDWVTPSRYAQPLRSRMEEGVRMVGARLGTLMARYPETLVTVSGDGEVELSFERDPMLADYSPFMIEEFRDWIRRSQYEGDLTPATDESGDGRTFNKDFKQSFTTWRLRYFDSSGPIAGDVERLPSSGPYFIAGGFDAPRDQTSDDRFQTSWMQFREQVVGNYVRDFASWVNLPESRFYSHQIPGDFLFEEKNHARLKTSASSVNTAFIAPFGSAGVTTFNSFDGKKTKRTATPDLFRVLSRSSSNWGIFEYNPSTPADGVSGPSTDQNYYLKELRSLYSFRPHVIVPFAYTDAPTLKAYSIKDSTFETALKRFVEEVGATPWSPR